MLANRLCLQHWFFVPDGFRNEPSKRSLRLPTTQSRQNSYLTSYLSDMVSGIDSFSPVSSLPKDTGIGVRVGAGVAVGNNVGISVGVGVAGTRIGIRVGTAMAVGVGIAVGVGVGFKVGVTVG